MTLRIIEEKSVCDEVIMKMEIKSPFLLRYSQAVCRSHKCR